MIIVAFVRVFIDYAMDAAGYIPGGLIAGLLAMAQFSAVWYFARSLCKRWDKYKENKAAKKKRSIVPPERIATNEDQIRFCRICGEKLVDSARFCRKCGTQLIKE